MLAASLTNSGGLGGQLGDADGDQDAIVLLIRGVGSHLDVPARETRLRGMRVGEAVAALGGQSLHFDELDGEREEEQWRSEEPANEKVEENDDITNGGVKEVTGVGGSAGKRDEIGDEGSGKKKSRSKNKNAKKKTKGKELKRGVAALDAEKIREHGKSVSAACGGAGGRGGVDDDYGLDPDMLLPLGGAGSGSESQDEDMDLYRVSLLLCSRMRLLL